MDDDKREGDKVLVESSRNGTVHQVLHGMPLLLCCLALMCICLGPDDHSSDPEHRWK